jgi:hypothetical protein
MSGDWQEISSIERKKLRNRNLIMFLFYIYEGNLVENYLFKYYFRADGETLVLLFVVITSTRSPTLKE